jgi:hypothetical protein
MFSLLILLVTINFVFVSDVVIPLFFIFLNLHSKITAIPTPYIFSKAIYEEIDDSEDNVQFEIVDEYSADTKSSIQHIIDECMSEGSNLSISIDSDYLIAENKSDTSESVDENESIQDIREYGDFSNHTDEMIISHLEQSCEEIDLLENEFRESEKINGKYYLGYCNLYIDKLEREEPEILLSVALQPSTFFKYPIADILYYLHVFEIDRPQRIKKISIMKLDIYPTKCGRFLTYSVVLKTHWLRIVQRHWKKRFLEKKRIIEKRGLPENQMIKEISGVYPSEISTMPGLRGMMHAYKLSENLKNTNTDSDSNSYEFVNMSTICVVDGVMP